MATTAPAAQAPGAVGPHGFHPLRIARIVAETPDAASFVLDVPDDLRATFAYAAGQFCTFRATIAGERQHRCYSMSSAPGVDDELQVTVKRVPGGVVSNWMNDALAPGDTIEVSPPAGTFRLDHDGGGDVVAFGAGSGITPILSILKAGLATTARRFRLLYANRDRDSVIFAEAIDALAAAHPDRLSVLLHLDVDLGFVGPDTVRPHIDPASDTEFYLCGPGPFMEIVEKTLRDEGVADERIHVERFTPPEEIAEPDDGSGADTGSVVTIELDGRVETAEHHAGTTLLQTARQMGMTPPFSCESGNCATCIGKLLDGAVTMHVNDVLTDEEVAEGWVLTCQSVPTTPTVHVVYGE